MATPLSKTLLRIVVVLAVAFLAIQFVRPNLTNPPVTADLQAPPEVKQILKKSCYNCHSNETTLSWFDEPVPAIWIVAHDVTEARKHLNFSEIGKLPPAMQRGALYEAILQVQAGAMPLPPYQKLHPESAITPAELEILKNYLRPAGPPPPATSDEIADTNAERDKWMGAGSAAPSVQAAPNGVVFLPDYKNWKVINSSERFDNGFIKQILGNDVAIKAIAENHINPWPDGAVLAKISWKQQADEKGIIRPGKFFQVELMLRDRQKYASTLGWGWARWRGTDLKPYGKDASFVNECIGCHRPLPETDFVFTEPLRGQQ